MVFADVDSMASALEAQAPDLIFLDVELGTGDANEAFRAECGARPVHSIRG